MRGSRLAMTALALTLLLGCQEKLATPGECPGLCPGDRSAVSDTAITAVPGQDSTFGGYVARGEGNSLQLSNGLDATQARGMARFVRRDDSVLVRDTLRSYAIDSVSLGFTVLGRDSLATGLSVELYRLPQPATIDSTTTFAQVEAALTPGNLLATVPVPDGLRSGPLQVVFKGATLPQIQLPAADTGVLALAYRLVSPTTTALRIGSAAAGSAGPSFVTYLTANVADTALQHRALPRIVAFSSFVSSQTETTDSTTITVGGIPSARALLRFALPARIRDSTTIIRATLELTPLAPVTGLPNDSLALDVRALLSDLGAKSPRLASNSSQILLAYLTVGFADTLRVDVTSLVKLWQPPSRLPMSLFLALQPEGSSFSRAVFGSTRRGVAPRLLVTYVGAYPFETP